MAYGTEFIQQIYFHAPSPVRLLMSSAYGLQQRLKRYGREYYEHLDFLRAAQYLPNEEVEAFSVEKMKAFVNEAISSSPYYRDNHRYHPINDVSELSSLPVLPKNEVREYQDALVSSQLKQIPHGWAHTSGTSGKSLVFPLSTDCFRREYAFRGLHYEWGGVVLHHRMPFAFCAGHPVTFNDRRKPPFWVHDAVNNWLLLSSYHLAEKNMVHYVRTLERFKPVLIGGYPSSIYLLALAYLKHGSGMVRPNVVFTSSETLLDFQRETIEKAFASKVLNWYGTSEMVANIVECEMGELHLKHEHSFTEILNDKDQPCLPGETGRIVCTGFGNKAFPLIRYDIGDQVTIAANQSSHCNRGGLLIERVEGRTEDYVITPDGRLVGRLDHLFKDSRNVREAQIFQETIGEVELRIVKTDGYTSRDELAILEEARLRLGSSIGIRFSYPDAITRGPGGKFRFIFSKIDQEKTIRNFMNIS
jgi:phenylacetate-CoA ligase